MSRSHIMPTFTCQKTVPWAYLSLPSRSHLALPSFGTFGGSRPLVSSASLAPLLSAPPMTIPNTPYPRPKSRGWNHEPRIGFKNHLRILGLPYDRLYFVCHAFRHLRR